VLYVPRSEELVTKGRCGTPDQYPLYP
jgi:hypothetical protein